MYDVSEGFWLCLNGFPTPRGACLLQEEIGEEEEELRRVLHLAHMPRSPETKPVSLCHFLLGVPLFLACAKAEGVVGDVQGYSEMRISRGSQTRQ